jgi:hypothetical protein
MTAGVGEGLDRADQVGAGEREALQGLASPR